MRLGHNSVNITVMRKLGQKGSSTPLVLTVGILVLLLIGSLVFGIWAFSGRQNYKNNVNQIVAGQIKVAQAKTASDKDNEFAQKEKLPYKTYKGPSAFGSIVIKYPKTWSAYVDETSGDNDTVVDGYFHPGFVPGTQSTTAFALRVQIVSNAYSDELNQLAGSDSGLHVEPFRAKSVPTVLGARLDGQIVTGKQGSMVLLPLRDKTLKIWTESSQFVPDFNQVLANLSFSP